MLDKTWNRFVRCLMEARDIWDKHQDILLETTVREVESLSPEVQKILSVFRRTRFEVMLPRFMDYARGWGGLEEMLVKEAEEEKEEKKEKKVEKEKEVEELKVVGSLGEEKRLDEEEEVKVGTLEEELKKGGKEEWQT